MFYIPYLGEILDLESSALKLHQFFIVLLCTDISGKPKKVEGGNGISTRIAYGVVKEKFLPES